MKLEVFCSECILLRSAEEITRYLDRVDEATSYPATITLWSGSRDTVDMDLLYNLVRQVGSDRVFVDVPFPYNPPPLPSPVQSIIINSINSSLSLLSLAV